MAPWSGRDHHRCPQGSQTNRVGDVTSTNAGRFGKVVVGIDGRDGGRDAISLARLLAGPEGKLVLGHVTRHPSSAAPSAVADAGVGTEESPHDLLIRERDAAEVDATVVTLPASSVGEGLHRLTEREAADLLVVGSSHRGFLGRVLLNDDTRAALNGACSAVAVAPRGYAHAAGALKTIGVGYDESDEAQRALDVGRALGAQLDARVKALQVIALLTSSYAGPGMVAWGGALQEALDDAKRTMASLDGVEGDAVLGVAGEELAAFAQGVDLLVVGSRSYGPLKRLVLGSTSVYLAGHARCALLVLPRAADAA